MNYILVLYFENIPFSIVTWLKQLLKQHSCVAMGKEVNICRQLFHGDLCSLTAGYDRLSDHIRNQMCSSFFPLI